MEKALLSVSFGTSYAETREKTIDVVDARLAAAFPDRAFYSAWTSGRIVAKLRAERGEHHDTLDEAFARIVEDGVADLLVVTTNLMHGGEMRKVERAAGAWALEDGSRALGIAAPLMESAQDRQAMARVLASAFADVPDGDAVLLMGHGTTPPDGPAWANEVYSQIQDELCALGKTAFFVATVEGTPTFADVLPLVEQLAPARVHIAPLMMVAGDHARNDLAGDGRDSWRSQLVARGFEVVPVLRGLGEYAGVQELVCAHARDARPFEPGKAGCRG